MLAHGGNTELLLVAVRRAEPRCGPAGATGQQSGTRMPELRRWPGCLRMGGSCRWRVSSRTRPGRGLDATGAHADTPETAGGARP